MARTACRDGTPSSRTCDIFPKAAKNPVVSCRWDEVVLCYYLCLDVRLYVKFEGMVDLFSLLVFLFVWRAFL